MNVNKWKMSPGASTKARAGSLLLYFWFFFCRKSIKNQFNGTN